MQKLEHYIQVGQQRLRCGYTTGTCAAAAARGAAELLLTGAVPDLLRVETPSGLTAEIEVEEAQLLEGCARCAVRKDAGDDPDITDGVLVWATVERTEAPGVTIDGGEGVGRVTRPGLDQPPGAAAINRVPRRMITEQLEKALRNAGADCGLLVVISIPQGRVLAEKTFNPRLGIEGGLSVLGTSGIVRPMSEAALVASIHAELDVRRAEGTLDLLVSPGNYGADFASDVLGLDLSQSVQCSNYIGDTLDYAAAKGFRSLLLVGHLGKLVKCAAGVMNTHSRVADCRMETLAAHAALCGAGQETVHAILQAVTTEAAISVLRDASLLTETMDSVMDALSRHIRRRAGETLRVEAVLFTNQQGVLGETEGAAELLALHRKGELEP
ncbi:MAG: cobalt-precorrin-5B (C(1))-methyltransferase CbiD [Clostridiales bacterium]|nr:cobalt-precorrin-5B (C(1))-methyltransferase CbiD [Clostridiales bacterium]